MKDETKGLLIMLALFISGMALGIIIGYLWS